MKKDHRNAALAIGVLIVLAFGSAWVDDLAAWWTGRPVEDFREGRPTSGTIPNPPTLVVDCSNAAPTPIYSLELESLALELDCNGDPDR